MGGWRDGRWMRREGEAMLFCESFHGVTTAVLQLRNPIGVRQNYFAPDLFTCSLCSSFFFLYRYLNIIVVFKQGVAHPLALLSRIHPIIYLKFLTSKNNWSHKAGIPFK